MLDFVGGKCKQYMKNTQNCLTRTIITVAVTLPNRFLAHFVSFAGLVLAVQAFAGLAIFIIVGLAAAVASVPSAPSIVVHVITVLVTFPHRLGASSLDACHAAISSSLAVKTLAYLTVFDIAFSATAIASIPRASSYVVFVVTKSIAFEVGCPAPFLNDIHATIPFALVSTIQAQAFRTVAIVVVRAAAVSSVPVASRIVVLVITVLVAFPFGFLAASLNFVCAFVCRSFVLAVPACTLLAVLVVVGRATAIASIPIACSCKSEQLAKGASVSIEHSESHQTSFATAPSTTATVLKRQMLHGTHRYCCYRRKICRLCNS